MSRPPTTCRACGAEIPYTFKWGGCPRKYCARCLPPIAEIGPAEYHRRYLALNEQRRASYNARRRQQRRRAIA